MIGALKDIFERDPTVAGHEPRPTDADPETSTVNRS